MAAALKLSLPPGSGEGPPLEDNGPRRRRLLPGLVGVLVAVATIVTASALAPKSIPMREILVVARPLGPGEPVLASDWRTSFVPKSSGISAVLASQAPRLVGELSSQAWTPGTPITMAMLGGTPPRDVIGLSLRPGQAPSGLVPGNHVIVVAMASSSTAAKVAGDVAGTVETVSTNTSANVTNANVSIPAAPAVVANMLAAAAAGDVSVVLEAPNG